MGLWEWLFGSPKPTRQPKASKPAPPDPRQVEAEERKADEAALQALTPGSDATIRTLISQTRNFGVARTSAGNTLHDQLIGIGVTDDEMRVAAARVLASAGKAPTLEEVLVELSRRFAARPSADVVGLSQVLYSAALGINQSGDDHFAVLYESTRLRLMDLERSGIRRAEILTTGGASCAACSARKRLVWTVETALRNMPIPTKRCSHRFDADPELRGFCRCLWVAVID